MGKKAKEHKSGDFIFAKVKGYPAWPARVQSYNGKKYCVYFYGTGETANLPSNMIFEYEENKSKFLTKAVKRRDFNEAVKQIELDFVNKTPLEDIIGPIGQAPPANDTTNDSAMEDMDTSALDTTANDTVADTTATTQNDTVEDSDEAGELVIDEGKPAAKGRKSTAKTPKEPVATPKTPKAPRGRQAKKDQVETPKEMEVDEGKKDEEIVSRSGRKIRPKRYVDEQTEENSTLPPSKKRKTSTDKEKPDETAKKPDETAKKPDETAKKQPEKTSKSDYNNVTLTQLEDLKEPFKPADPEKENILIAYLPTGTYVGIKLFQSCPKSFKNDTSKLQWQRASALNALKHKMQLERGQISPKSIAGQLVMDLNLTDEEKTALDKERESEEKKSRYQFLRAEMKLIELDAKIKSCLCLEKADTELCLKLLDELLALNVRPLMLLKHPTCMETVKRMRAYVGNTPSWDLSHDDALEFSKQAHKIRKQADTVYTRLKDLFVTPEGLSFWEYFSSQVLVFKQATANMSADSLLEMVHEPIELTQPSSHTMKAAIDAANIEEPLTKEEKEDAMPDVDAITEAEAKKKDKSPKKEPAKKTSKKDLSKKEAPKKTNAKDDKNNDSEKEVEKEAGKDKEANGNEADDEPKDLDAKKDAVSKKKTAAAKPKKPSIPVKPVLKRQSSRKQNNDASVAEAEKTEDGTAAELAKESTEPSAEQAKEPESSETAAEPKDAEKVVANGDGKEDENKTADDAEEKTAEAEKPDDKKKGKEDKEKEPEDEPRAKRSRQDNKKSEAPPRSPARTRKTKA